MGCTVSVEGSEPNTKNKNIGNQISGSVTDYKAMTKHDKVRIEMVLDYWYDDEEWSQDKYFYYLDLLQGPDSKIEQSPSPNMEDSNSV